MLPWTRATPTRRQSVRSFVQLLGAELGYKIKLLGIAERTQSGIEQRVHPTMIPKSSSVAQVMGVTNAVTIASGATLPVTEISPTPPWAA
jgi:homoserine dehydrogenase